MKKKEIKKLTKDQAAKDIDKLKRDLKVITRSRKTQRKNRQGEFSVSLVGYTNAGKSTIMNLLTDAMLAN